MSGTFGSYLRTGLAGALALFGVACSDQPEPLATATSADLAQSQAQPELFVAQLTPLNNSGVGGAAAFAINNGEFTARVYATGTVPGRIHPQHIHGLEGMLNSTCPTPAAARRIPGSPESAANPDQLISVPEGLPDYGAIRVPLDDQLNGTAETFPTATPQGVVNYLQKTSFADLQAAVSPFDLHPVDQLVVVVHGGFVTAPGGQQVYDPSLPVACAQIRMTSVPELQGKGTPTTFTVTIENVSQPGLLDTDRAMGTVPLSPGAFATFTGSDPAFTVGALADEGTERIAEDGFPGPPLPLGSESTLLREAPNVKRSGVFLSPGGPDNGPAILAGESATFTVTAVPGDRLQIETMFVQSNDWFYAFGDGGLALFDRGEPIRRDVTSELVLYDAGTEEDSPPGTGPFQKPVQPPMATNVGPSETVPIRRAADRHPSFDIPATSSVIRVTITPQPARPDPDNQLALPPGFRAEKVVGGLTFPTSVTWDDQGRMYVAEAGGGLGPPRQIAPSRILRVEDGRATPVIDVTDEVEPSLIGLTWHNGAFFITHRSATDLTGTVSRVTLDGQVTQILTGIIDSQGEHQINDVVVGPDGRMYVTVGQTGNAAVMGLDVAAFIMLSPNVHSRPCRDLTLTGRNFKTPDFRTPQQGDSVLTGAFVPFGTPTTPGQVIPGVNKCGGSILVFDPDNAEATVRPFADGFRNLLGLAFDPQSGAMYVAENGYDIRGSRPVQDTLDGTFRVREGTWYGHANFSAADEPLTDAVFDVPDSLQAPIFIDGRPIGKDLGFVIDLEASGLSAPDPSLLVGRHEWQSSPSFIGVAPRSWGNLAGQIFAAEFGDLRPNTNPLRERQVGRRVVRVNPATGVVTPFVGNRTPQPAEGEGLNRPFDVAFGPDGAMYIVDFGVVEVIPSATPPFVQRQGTGAIWRITRGAR